MVCALALSGPRARVEASPCWQVTTPAAQTVDDGAVAELDGVRITPEMYASWLLRTHGERLAKIFGSEQVAVERAARRAGVELSAAELDAHVQEVFEDRVKHAFHGDVEAWRAELLRTGRTEAGARRQRETEARPFLLAGKMASVGRVVPEHKVVREWQRMYGKLGRRYDLLMTFTKAEVLSPAQRGPEATDAARAAAWAQAKVRAEAVRARLVAGEDFGKVAREVSEDLDTKDGRGRPSDFRDEGWPKGFHEELAKLAVGEISPPLQGKGGWWIVKILEVRATPLESVRGELVSMLEAKGPEPDEVGAILEPIHTQTKVELLPALWRSPGGGELGGVDEPVMLVDGEPVSRASYARYLLYWQGETALSRYIEDFAVERRAQAAGIVVTEAEVRERVKEHVDTMIDEGFKRQREGWLEFLRRAGRTEESFCASLAERWRIDLLAEKLMQQERVIDERMLRERYRAEFGEDGERLETAWIVKTIQGEAPAADATREVWEAALAKASEIARAALAAELERVRQPADFAVVAREVSDDVPTKANGGRRQGRFRVDAFPEAIATAVTGLQVGQSTPPILYGRAWVSFQLVERRRVTYEDAKSELEFELKHQRPVLPDIGNYRNSLARQVKAEILPGMAR